jgi:hypothetical protein
MFARHSAFKGIIKSGRGLRRGRAASNVSSSSSSSHLAVEHPNKNQALHQGLEQLQRRPGQSTTLSSSSTAAADNPNAAYTIANKPTRLDRLNQAIVNAVGSFLVVLLAAQSYKAGAERRRALDHLEAATEVLKETQHKLKRLVDPATADEIAAACQPVIVAQQRRQPKNNNRRARGADNGEEEDGVQQQLSAIIHAELRSRIDPKTDLDEDERDKELVRELVKTIEPPTRKQVFTI